MIFSKKSSYLLLQKLHMITKKPQIIAFLYKLFIVTMIIAQVCNVVFQVVNVYTLICNVILTMYLVFRYYLLFKLSKRADKINLTLTDYLQIKNKGRCVCVHCGNEVKG